MSTTNRKSTANKTVHIIARISFKADPRKVVYRVRSSDGKKIYCTFLFNGKSASCECPAKKPCYHMEQIEQIEAQTQPERTERMTAREREKARAVTHKQEQEEFPYGLEILWDDMSGVVISDVRINFEGIHYVEIIMSDGEWISLSIDDLRDVSNIPNKMIMHPCCTCEKPHSRIDAECEECQSLEGMFEEDLNAAKWTAEELAAQAADQQFFLSLGNNKHGLPPRMPESQTPMAVNGLKRFFPNR